MCHAQAPVVSSQICCQNRIVLLALDYDGTITEVDTLQLIIEHWAPKAFDPAEAALEQGKRTLHDVLRQEFAAVKATESEVLDFVHANVRLREGLPELLAFCRRANIDVVVLSAGFNNIIEPLLAARGIELPVLANRAAFSPDGAELFFTDESLCSHCGESCKRNALIKYTGNRPVIYAGDGFSDRCSADAADFVFARRNLAEYRRRQGLPYEPFEDFHAVRRKLALNPLVV